MAVEPENPARCPPEQPACPLPPPPPLVAYAPFEATVADVLPATNERGSVVVLRADAAPDVTFWAIGAQPDQGLDVGQHVYAGEDVGSGVRAIGLERVANGTRVVLPLPAFFSSAVRSAFASQGFDVDALTFPRASSAPARLACDPTTMPVGPASEEEWVSPQR
jgi:hypothetical protein